MFATMLSLQLISCLFKCKKLIILMYEMNNIYLSVSSVNLQIMKLIVPGINVKVFGKAIHCLAKIGDEVYLESEGEGLTLRTVNISR